MLYRSCTEVVHRLYRNCPSCILVVFWLYFGCISCICLVTLTTHRNFAPHSRNQNSCLRCNFLQALIGLRLEAFSPLDSPSKLGSPLGSSLLGSRLEAFSPRDSPSKLGSPLGSSLLDILEQSTTIATGLLCILHKPFNVVIKEHDINIIYI